MRSGTLLDLHDSSHPTPWWRRQGQRPTALQLATAALEECRREYLHHKEQAEVHVALVRVLRERDARLQEDIVRLSAKAPDSPAGE